MRDLTSAERLWYVTRSVLTSPFSLALWAAGGVASVYLMRLTQGAGLLPMLPLIAVACGQVALLYTRLHDEDYLRGLFQRAGICGGRKRVKLATAMLWKENVNAA